jgi:hypothetical protein
MASKNDDERIEAAGVAAVSSDRPFESNEGCCQCDEKKGKIFLILSAVMIVAFVEAVRENLHIHTFVIHFLAMLGATAINVLAIARLPRRLNWLLYGLYGAAPIIVAPAHSATTGYLAGAFIMLCLMELSSLASGKLGKGSQR